MDYINLVFCIIIILVVTFFVYTPRRKQEQELKKMQDKLKEGDKIITYSGLSGKITKVNDNGTILIALNPNDVIVSIEKWAVAGIDERS